MLLHSWNGSNWRTKGCKDDIDLTIFTKVDTKCSKNLSPIPLKKTSKANKIWIVPFSVSWMYHCSYTFGIKRVGLHWYYTILSWKNLLMEYKTVTNEPGKTGCQQTQDQMFQHWESCPACSSLDPWLRK